MKSHLPPMLSNRQRAIVNRAYEQKAFDETTRTIRRYMKMSMIVLNREFGFGKERLDKFIEGVQAISMLSENDEEYWTHIDMRLDQLKIRFEQEQEK